MHLEYITTRSSMESRYSVAVAAYALISLLYILVQGYDSTLTFYISLVLPTIFIVFLMLFGFKDDLGVVQLYILFLCSQNLLLGLGTIVSSSYDYNQLSKLLLYKEVLSVIIFGGLALRFILSNNGKVALRSIDFIVMGILGVIIVSFFRSNAPIFNRIAYLRNFSFVFIYFYIGRMLRLGGNEAKRLMDWLFLLAVGVVVFGFVEVTFISSEMWFNGLFDLKRVYIAKTLSRYEHLLRNGVPLMWFSKLGGVFYRRMVSIYMEPVNLSYFLSVPLLWSFITEKHKFLSTLLLFGACCTLGKGGLLIFFLSLGLIMYVSYSNENNFNKLLLKCFVILLAVVLLSFNFIKDSALPHFIGLLSIPSNLVEHPVGNGLGVGGNFARISGLVSSRAEWLKSGGESATGTIAYQLGVPGLLLYIFFFYGISNRMFISAVKKESSKGLMGVGLSVAIFTVMLFQENAMSPHASSIIFIVIGFIYEKSLCIGET
ncbi:hypothetical protein [Fusibacter sp. JL216-2]|uniref:hypothetical protein n=1 Tax=Fusibacter sp. JL216-2 TaxID=3071453 RepID=UPI003D32D1F4